MTERLGGYVPRISHHPTLKEVCSELGIEYEELGYRKNSTLVNKRALKWLNRAAFHAYAILNAVIQFYPKENRKHYELTLKELALIFEKSLSGQENDEDIKKQVETALDTVARAGNIFNKTTPLLPKKVLKAVLEARDICDEAIRQPTF